VSRLEAVNLLVDELNRVKNMLPDSERDKVNEILDLAIRRAKSRIKTDSDPDMKKEVV